LSYGLAGAPTNQFGVSMNGGRATEAKEPATFELQEYAGQSVIVVDDDPAMLELLTLQLMTAGLRVIPFNSARDMLDSGREASAHCIVSDVRMPDMSGLELQKELTKRRSRLPFVIVTAHGDIPLAVEAMRAGAVDIIEKPFASARLVSAVARALTLRAQSDTEGSVRETARSRLALLTSREREVLGVLVDGKQSKAIAEVLRISQRTVEVHRANIMRKLKVRTVGELIRFALNAQLAVGSSDTVGGSLPSEKRG
jgi:two-component system response regulator FixJ